LDCVDTPLMFSSNLGGIASFELPKTLLVSTSLHLTPFLPALFAGRRVCCYSTLRPAFCCDLSEFIIDILPCLSSCTAKVRKGLIKPVTTNCSKKCTYKRGIHDTI
jgi:hypothetical protein